MAEWLIAAVLKTVDLRGSVGSNPTSSEKTLFFPLFTSTYELKVSPILTRGMGSDQTQPYPRPTISGLKSKLGSNDPAHKKY